MKTHLSLVPASSLETETLSAPRLDQGFSRGSLVEVSGGLGSGKTEWVLDFLATQPQARVAWLEESWTLFPPALLHKGLSLERFLCVEYGRKPLLPLLRTISQSGLFPFLVVKPETEARSEVFLRRLQLTAAKSQSVLFLLVPTPTREGAWPIKRQIELGRFTGATRLKVRK